MSEQIEKFDPSTFKVSNLCQIKAFREQRDNKWSEFIAVYDGDGKKLAESIDHHPEGSIYFEWNGFEFLAPVGYSGKNKAECYVKINDKLFFED